MIKLGVKELVEEANAHIVTHTVEEVMRMQGKDDGVLVDIRDLEELKELGTLPGAVHASRGMLEMYFDPKHGRHKPVFSEDKEFVMI